MPSYQTWVTQDDLAADWERQATSQGTNPFIPVLQQIDEGKTFDARLKTSGQGTPFDGLFTEPPPAAPLVDREYQAAQQRQADWVPPAPALSAADFGAPAPQGNAGGGGGGGSGGFRGPAAPPRGQVANAFGDTSGSRMADTWPEGANPQPLGGTAPGAGFGLAGDGVPSLDDARAGLPEAPLTTAGAEAAIDASGGTAAERARAALKEHVQRLGESAPDAAPAYTAEGGVNWQAVRPRLSLELPAAGAMAEADAAIAAREGMTPAEYQALSGEAQRALLKRNLATTNPAVRGAMSYAIGAADSIERTGQRVGAALDLTDAPASTGSGLGDAVQAVGDVANIVPAWQGANAEFSLIREALISAGVVPSDGLVADLAAMALQVGGPGVVSAVSKRFGPQVAEVVGRKLAGGARAAEGAAAGLAREGEQAAPVLGIMAGQGAQAAEVAPPFYSQLQRTISEKMPNRAAPAQIEGILRGSAVKPDELKWTGFDDFLAQAKAEGRPVTKQEALDFLKANEVSVEEVMKGGRSSEIDALIARREQAANELRAARSGLEEALPPNDPQRRVRADAVREASAALDEATAAVEASRTTYRDYTLPGADKGSYRELLLKLPSDTDAVRYAKSSEMAIAAAYRQIEDAGLSRNATFYELSQRFGRDEAQRLNEARMGVPSGIAPAMRPDYFAPHFGGEPNILAHVRFNDRVTTGPDGRPLKTLFLEEVQSDWHQAGRSEGYQGELGVLRNEVLTAARANGVDVERVNRALDFLSANPTDTPGRSTFGEWDILSRAVEGTTIDLNRIYDNRQYGVPAAPFAKTWPELAFKRMMRYASENGYDRIAWTSGAIHADETAASRYGTEVISWQKQADGRIVMDVRPQVGGAGTAGMDLGQEAAARGLIKEGRPVVVNGPEDIQRALSEAGLEAPGQREIDEQRTIADKAWQRMQALDEGTYLPRKEGMAGFYDQALPEVARKLGKKFGAQVSDTHLPTGETVHALDVTPQMRDTVMGQGQPLFAQAGGGAASGPGSDLLSAAQRAARSSLPPGAAMTRGQAAADLATGAASGVYGAVTAPEDASWQDRAARAAEFGIAGTLAPGAARGLVREAAGAIRPGLGRLADQLGAVAGETGASAAAARQTAGESFDRIAEMYAKGQPAPAPTTEIEKALNSIQHTAARDWLDTGASLEKAQRLVYDALGRKPTAAENAYALFRLSAGRGGTVGQNVADNLLPALKQLKGNDEIVLNTYLTQMDNADVAAHIGRRTVRDVLDKPLPPTAGRAALQRGEQSLRMRQARVPDAQQAAEAAQAAVKQAAQDRTAVLAQTKDQLARARRIAQHADPDVAAEGTARIKEITAQRAAAAAAVREAKAQAAEAATTAATATRRVKSAETRVGRIAAAIDARVAEATAIRQQEALKAGALAQQGRAFSGGAVSHTPEEINQALVDKYGPEQAQRVRGAAQGVWDFTKGLRQRLHESGGIDTATLNEWEQAFPHYVKTDVLKYLPEGGARPAPGQSLGARSLSITDLGINKLTTEGTQAARDVPLNSVIRQAFAVETQAQKNELANAILKMVEADRAAGDQSTGLASLFKPLLSPKQAAERGLKLGEFVPEGHTLANDELRFGAIVDGTPQTFIIPKTLEPLVSVDPAHLPDKLQWLVNASLGPVLRATATTWNARFLPTNAIRDALVYAQRSTALMKATPGQSAQEFLRAYRDVFSKGGEADLAAMRRGGAGQSIGSMLRDNPTAELRRLRRDGKLAGLIRPVDSKADYLGVISDVLTLPLRATVVAAGERIEQAPRLAAYRLAKKLDLPEQQALMWSRDITLDFSRGGRFAKVANVFIPFFNAGVQGTDRLLRMDFAKGNRAASAISIGATMVVPMLAAELWNQSQYPEDYADVPDYEKNRGIVLMLPVNAPPKADGTRAPRPHLLIPTNQNLTFLNTALREAAGAAAQGSAVRWEEMLASLIGSVSPLPVDTGAALSAVLPPSVQMVAEQAANHDFYRGRQIVPDSMKNLLPEDQTQPGVSPLSNALAGGASRVSRAVGGPGISPLRVDYALKSVAPGIMNVLGAGGAPPPNQTMGLYDVPGAGGLASTVLRQSGGQVNETERNRLDRQRDEEIRSIMAEIAADPEWSRYTPEDKAAIQRVIANKVTAKYDTLRRAGQAQRTAEAQAR